MEARHSGISLQLLSRPEAGHDEVPEYSEHDLSRNSEATQQQSEELPEYSRSPVSHRVLGRGHSTALHRSAWVTVLTVIYVALVLYAWIMLVVLSFRPLTTKSWAARVRALYMTYPQHPDYARDAQIYRSARVIQTFVSVLTVPWISAVCASAAVVYVQNQRDIMSLRLRKVMTLADRRWNDFGLYKALFSGGWKQHGSRFLLLAIFIHLVGAITYPIQSIFLAPKFIKVPVSPNRYANVPDFSSNPYSYAPLADGTDIVLARDALSNALPQNYQAFLWSNGSGAQLSSLGDISSLTDPFYSPVPIGFNSGVLKQFAPRVNSTASYETIEANEFPLDCASKPGAFFSDYSSSSRGSSWRVVACMPEDMTQSPWQITRGRQDFSEVLYLNLSSYYFPQSPDNTPKGGSLYRITVNTTAGYFELPNYMNNGVSGPLLANDPSSLCGEDCMEQYENFIYKTRVRRAGNSSEDWLQGSAWNPISTTKKGPLLTTVLALFGPGSFLDTFPEVLAVLENKLATSNLGNFCVDIPPLTALFLSGVDGYGDPDNYFCLNFVTGYGIGPWKGGDLVQIWVGMINVPDVFNGTFTAAAYVVNQLFIESLPGVWSVFQDLGSDMEIPDISQAGIIVVSTLMALYLLPLLALAVYAGYYPRWTERLDSFVMLRFGAIAGDKVFPLLVARKTDEIPELDEMPGVVRDVSVPSSDEVVPIGRLGLGEGEPLCRLKRYECYKADNDPLSQAEEVELYNHARGLR